jgi:hypothetical protein
VPWSQQAGELLGRDWARFLHIAHYNLITIFKVAILVSKNLYRLNQASKDVVFCIISHLGTEGNPLSVSRRYINDGDLIGIVSSLKYLRGIATMPGRQGLKASLPGLLGHIVRNWTA